LFKGCEARVYQQQSTAARVSLYNGFKGLLLFPTIASTYRINSSTLKCISNWINSIFYIKLDVKLDALDGGLFAAAAAGSWNRAQKK